MTPEGRGVKDGRRREEGVERESEEEGVVGIEETDRYKLPRILQQRDDQIAEFEWQKFHNLERGCSR
jgi:hypothetical protein